MNSLEETVVVEPVVKQKKHRVKKPKAEPLVEALKSEPEPEPVSLPVAAEPEPVALAVCEACGEPAPFSDAEMDIYRRINAYKRKLLRLKKIEFVSAEV
jgi:hypothetical protein